MSRMWRTVFRSANKQVLVRGGGSAGQSRGDWVFVLLWLGMGGFALYAVVLFVMAYWPWLLGVGALGVAWYCWSACRRR